MRKIKEMIGIGILFTVVITGCVNKAEAGNGTLEKEAPQKAESQLKKREECWLCGNSNRSLMGYFRKFDDIGIIDVNNWYVLNFGTRNFDEEGNLTGPQRGSRQGFTNAGEGGCNFETSQTSDRGIAEVEVSFGDDSKFDVSRIQKNLCQGCLDKVVESMEVYDEEEPWAVCLVDFQTLEIYPLQEHNRMHMIRDFYVRIESKDKRMEVQAVYAPILENGEKPEE